MPSVSSPSVSFSTLAREIPQPVIDALKQVERDANVIYPSLLKCLEQESRGKPSTGQLWMWVENQGKVDFILSSTTGYMGDYPIFIVGTLPYEDVASPSNYVQHCMHLLAAAVYQEVDDTRVYSVFAPKQLTLLFAEEWNKLSRVSIEQEPYYDAHISYCTRSTLKDRRMAYHGDFQTEIRPAIPNDIPEIASLCKDFAADCFPFILDSKGAMREAQVLVSNQQVWVNILHYPEGHSRMASIAAFTRNSESVAAISKVYTDKDCRRKGCAELLVRRVCKELLKEKDCVVLYVGNDNSAAHVYGKVGFVGLPLSPSQNHVPGVEPWLELGFDRKIVSLGHW